MAYENLCMYCFEDKGTRAVCPHCGRDSRDAVPAIQLMPGTLLHNNRFLVGRARGQDANGIVYAAYDTRKELPLRIREYLPRESAKRQGDGSVSPLEGQEADFRSGMERLKESVESAEDPRKRHFYFEENGTAYIAERHSATAAQAKSSDRGEEADGEGRNIRQIVIIAAIAAVVVLGVALAVIHFLNRAVDTPITPVSTLAPETTMWMPEATPSPTPYVGTTIGTIRDPDLSWLDYVYPGDVNEEYQQLNPTAASSTSRATARATATPTPTPAARITAAAQTTQSVNTYSSAAQIRELQNLLVQTGWLTSSGVTGSYDTATRQAVREFQQYMNDTYAIDPKLTVDGLAGPKTLYWLYQTELSAKPSPTPTAPPRVTAQPGTSDVVDENSSASRVRSVQNKLIVLDLLPEGAADGVYGASTREAVARFQQVVNRLQARQVLSESGTADADTLAYLDYYADWWSANKPTPTPVPTPTPAPTATPTAVPDEMNIVVDASSDTAAIRYVQRMLVGLGVMNSSVDGQYGSGTTRAVRAFQTRANELLEADVLPVTGTVDALTLRYMERFYEEVLNATPVPEETIAPTATEQPAATPVQNAEEETQISVDRNSDPESIRFVQTMLAELGLLDASGIDGSFGSATTRAIERFQTRVNELEGSEVLRTDGVCDATTLSYLEYYSAQMNSATDAPMEAPTTEPTATAQAAVVDSSSSAEEITSLQSMLAELGLLNASDVDGRFGSGTERAISAFQSRVNELQGADVLTVSGIADRATMDALQMYVEEYRSRATEAPTAEPTSAAPAAIVGADSSADAIRQLQTLLSDVHLMDASAATGNYTSQTTEAVRAFQARVNELQGAEALSVTGVVDEDTMSALEYYASLMRERDAEAAGSTPEPEDPGEETQNVVNASSDPESIRFVQTMLSTLGLIDSDSVDGVFGNGTTRAIEEFQLRVNQMLGEGTVRTDGVCDATTLSYLETYYEQMLNSATDAPSNSSEEESRQVGSVTAPEIELDGTVSESDGVRFVSGDTTIRWGSTGDVDHYHVTITDSAGQEYVNRDTNETQVSIPASRMSADLIYTARIGVMPVNGEYEDALWSTLQFALQPAPSATESGSFEPITISAASDSDTILALQRALYSAGYLTQGAQGEFDQNTRQAVAQFQLNMNATYIDDPDYEPLTVIDPTNEAAVVDARTINLLQGLTR